MSRRRMNTAAKIGWKNGRHPALYVITCPPSSARFDTARSRKKTVRKYERMVTAACRGGADIIQLREKCMPALELVALAKRLKKACSRYRVPLLINDRPDIALASGADGVHLGHMDLPVRAARKILGSRAVIGRSAHSLAQARQAQRDGADYVSCGPVFATPTKPDYRPVGIRLIRQYIGCIKIPFVAIGGIDAKNIGGIAGAGAPAVAVVRAVCGSRDPEKAARRLKLLLKSAVV